MLKFVSGDFFDFDADVMVNTVNCVGVMGAGAALAFKTRFPDMYSSYVDACKDGVVRPGHAHVWVREDMLSKRLTIVNLPTKIDWRKPSEYEYVEKGLAWMSEFLETREGQIVTMPALGCGNGGLDWELVRPMIEHQLGATRATLLVFEPSDSARAARSHGQPVASKASLASRGLACIDAGSKEYPSQLSNFTKKSLYTSPIDSVLQHDIALIASTRPTQQEAESVRKFVDLCIDRGQTLIMGSSAFDRKLAKYASERGLRSSCVLPTGIGNETGVGPRSIEKDKIQLISIGAPFRDFDRYAFMPSVLLRFHLARSAMVFTESVAWMKRYSEVLESCPSEIYFVRSPEVDQGDYFEATGLKSWKLSSPTDFEEFFRPD